MRLFRIAVVAATSGLLLTACTPVIGGDWMNAKRVRPSGKVISKDRGLSGFESVALSGLGEVVLAQGANDIVVVEADDNIQEHLIAEVKDGVLNLRIANNVSFSGSPTIRYLVTLKSIKSVSISGLGSVRGANIDTSALSVSVSGGGDVLLNGKAAVQTASISGLGKLDLANLSGKSGSVDISGAGDATINVSDALNVSISGLGSVHYRGTPELSQQISGGGSVAPVQP